MSTQPLPPGGAVAEHWQRRIARELEGNEQLLWAGQPDLTMAMVRHFPTIAGLMLIAGVLCTGVAWLSWDDVRQFGAGAILPGVLLLIFISLPLLMLWHRRQARRTCYALTSRRGLVFLPTLLGRSRLTSYPAAQLREARFERSWLFGAKAGDWVFSKLVSTTVKSFYEQGWSGPTRVEVYRGVKRYGFLMLRDARAIETLLRRETGAQAQSQPRPPEVSMTIPIQCPACKATFKAPGKYAGKKVKCPKCGQGIGVPDLASAVTAVSAGGSAPAAPAPPRPGAPAPQAPPALRRDASVAPHLQVSSFDDLKVPRRLRRTIEETVGEEQTLWLGRPSPQSLYFKAKIAMLVGVVLCIAIGAGAFIGVQQLEEDMAKLIAAGIAGLMLLVLGLPLATMPVWVRWLINYRDCYALTPTRALVFDNEKILKAKVRSFSAAELQQRRLIIKDDGSGSIIFAVDVLDLGERTKRRTRDREGPQGQKIRETTITTKREKARKGVGFEDIENVEAVEAMLRQAFKLGPPAAKDVA